MIVVDKDCSCEGIVTRKLYLIVLKHPTRYDEMLVDTVKAFSHKRDAIRNAIKRFGTANYVGVIRTRVNVVSEYED
jgi:hypothetical protein